jgi:hypothetical protein
VISSGEHRSRRRSSQNTARTDRAAIEVQNRPARQALPPIRPADSDRGSRAIKLSAQVIFVVNADRPMSPQIAGLLAVRAVRSVFCWILRWAIIRWTVPDRLTLSIIPLGLLKISVADKNSSSRTLGLNGILRALKQPSTRTLVRRLVPRKNRGSRPTWWCEVSLEVEACRHSPAQRASGASDGM